MWGVLGPSRFDNPFTFLLSFEKRHSTVLNYLMKYLTCRVDVTGIALQLHTFLVQLLYFFSVIMVENYLNQSWSSLKSCANLAGHNLLLTDNVVICSKSYLIMELKYESIIVPWFKDQPQFKWLSGQHHLITLPDAVFYL